jgi:hypothetical protein
LLSKRLIALDEIFRVNEKIEKKLNHLKYISEKEAVVIENLMDKLLHETCGPNTSH